MLEYANQIENHTQRLLSIIQMNNWRTNPSILAGMKIAVLRKAPTPQPTIVIGLCVDATPSTGYSKIRVAFDVDKSTALQGLGLSPRSNDYHLPNQNPSTPSANPYAITSKFGNNSSRAIITPTSSTFSNEVGTPRHSESSNSTTLTSPKDLHKANSLNTTQILKEQQIFVGDVGEPFWCQNAKEGACWCEPDEIFLTEAKKLITLTDKRIFWEMIRTIIELPQLSSHSKSGIRNTKDLGIILKKIENKILWTFDGPECLLKDVAMDLLTSAYVIPMHKDN